MTSIGFLAVLRYNLCYKHLLRVTDPTYFFLNYAPSSTDLQIFQYVPIILQLKS